MCVTDVAIAGSLVGLASASTTWSRTVSNVLRLMPGPRRAATPIRRAFSAKRGGRFVNNKASDPDTTASKQAKICLFRRRPPFSAGRRSATEGNPPAAGGLRDLADFDDVGGLGDGLVPNESKSGDFFSTLAEAYQVDFSCGDGLLLGARGGYQEAFSAATVEPTSMVALRRSSTSIAESATSTTVRRGPCERSSAQRLDCTSGSGRSAFGLGKSDWHI